MQIEIKKCICDTYWYHDRIGDVFNVELTTHPIDKRPIYISSNYYIEIEDTTLRYEKVKKIINVLRQKKI